jgi:hypothetical protein
MAITFFGVASTPADNGSQTGPGPVAVTPPASMQDGDLCVVYVSARQAATLTDHPRMYDASNVATQHGGQTWNRAEHNVSGCDIWAGVYWCRFNGTWSANPAWRCDAVNVANAFTVVMLVFRPSSSSKIWQVDVGPNHVHFAAPTTPFTVTATGLTTTRASTVTIASWFCRVSNTWGSMSGSGWDQTGLGAQYRNTFSSTWGFSFAYKIQTSTGATGNVSQNESAANAGDTFVTAFAEVDPLSGGPVRTVAYVQSAKNSNETSAASIANNALSAGVTSGNAVIGYAHFETQSGGSITTIRDNQSNDYEKIVEWDNSDLAQHCVLFWRPNITNAPTIVTVTFSASEIARGIVVSEVAGIGSLTRAVAMDWLVGVSTTQTTPTRTPPQNGNFFFGGISQAGAPIQDTDFFNPQGSWTERQENLGVVASGRNPSASYDQIQATAAALAFVVSVDGDQTCMLAMASFAPAVAAAASGPRTAPTLQAVNRAAVF